MKKVILLVASAVVLFSCNKLAEGEYIITGNVKGMKTGLVYLEKQGPMGMGFMAVDTVKIEDGKFEIKGKASEPEIHFIHVDKVNGKLPVILEGGEIEVAFDKDSLVKSKISGTYNNEEFNKFNEESEKIQKKLKSKIVEFQQRNKVAIENAQKSNDTVAMNKLRAEYDLIQKDITDYTFGYPKSHPKSFISVLILQMMATNPKFTPKEIETIYNSFDENQTGKSHQRKLGCFKKKAGSQSTVQLNQIAPDFKAPTPEGKMVSLKQSMGKVTLIDFWASWCMPCRKENPKVVALYNEFHSKGFNIISVSLDSDAGDWKEAIAKDGLTWTQVSNLKEMDDPIVKRYGVTLIPTTFLLDATGKVVGIDLPQSEMKHKIQELLQK